MQYSASVLRIPSIVRTPSKVRTLVLSEGAYVIIVSEFLLPHLQVKMDTELEQAQRITEQKKQAVHDELIRKSAGKEVSFESPPLPCGHTHMMAWQVCCMWYDGGFSPGGQVS